ncbi:MAG: hypothetical protein ACQKBU_05680 [Verrucomicrobiales bacterium]
MALFADEPVRVRTETEVESAWMGQQVRFVVTLFSPGPFTGTAVFQIPEMQDTVISKVGSPVVGSEVDGGQTWMTQRHEFDLFTQQVGGVEIPSFKVSFESKDGFLGDSIARQGETDSLQFVSKRPPGTEAWPFVVTSSSLEVSEAWSEEDGATLEAGELVTRSIRRTATDTSAMFLDPFRADSMPGVRVYGADPQIDETSQRGVTEVSRTDAIRYQFSDGGSYEFPEIRYSWWDPLKEELQTVHLEGRAFTAKLPPLPPEPIRWKRLFGGMLVAGLFFWGAFRGGKVGARQIKRRWSAWYNRPSNVAARKLRKACRRDDAKAAYTSLLAWKGAVGMREEFPAPLNAEVEALSCRLFGRVGSLGDWKGKSLQVAFRRVESELRRGGARSSVAGLPELNLGLSHDRPSASGS